MNTYLTRFGFGGEVMSWLEKLSCGQARHILSCIAKVLEFSEKNKDFFQGCGLYVVGSSLTGGFNDVDIVIVGLDFRAVVSYDKIFLMDPETLIQEEVLVEPRLFLITKEDENGEPMILEPVTGVKNPDFSTSLEAWGRMGLEHNGIRYDYNIERFICHSLDLTGFCSYHAWPSSLTKEMNKLLYFPEDELSLNAPFDNYGFDGIESFLVYRFPIENQINLPGVKNSVLEEVKPIDFCIHAENLQREEWKRHQRSLGLPYLALKEWPRTSLNRKIITELDHPRFIDPNGIKRATTDSMFFSSFYPEKTPDEPIDI